ncbi:MAG TPA: protease modulator HflC [Moraxellaceae bacterium]|jgi:membrane protease subunit HflC|nr:protease modulator HflC [Moraxellaceae bacterium]HQV40539.1 protease modulator HflC [Moraxellaceae bacterium]HQX89928.1 protease modulator HflC [Moraxellaceae bacterium]
MSPRAFNILSAVLLVLFVANGALYTITETERGVLMQFGEVIDPDLKPGLHVKLPIIHEVRKFDSRTQVSDSERTEYLTKESKFLIVDAYVMWRVDNVQRYFTNTGGDPAKAELLLMPRVKDGLKNKVSERTVHEVVSGQRDALMTDLTREVNALALKEFGIKVVDVRVKRVDFPTSTSESIYNRMRTEREREAREHRSQGTEIAETIKAEADREQRVLLAEAYRKAETLRGEGDALATSISAKAFGKDAEFYKFYRSLQAYRASFSKPTDVMVLKSDSEFLRHMKGPGN